jgi:glycosyltransferase involved in cell wall biosynthesis
MRISLITPTADQPLGLSLLERYIAAQTVKPDEWIVADDGDVPATLTMGQTHIVRKRTEQGGRSLATNMLAALEAVTGDIVIVAEHDDLYLPNHIAECVKGLAKQGAYGCPTLCYYHVRLRIWAQMRNRGSALCQTAFRSSLIPDMRRSCEAAYAANTGSVDWKFWEPRQQLAKGPQTVIGIKGLPGRVGLGIGHRPKDTTQRRWNKDPHMIKLKEWAGAHWKEYAKC